MFLAYGYMEDFRYIMRYIPIHYGYYIMHYFGTRAYLFSPEEGSCYVFSTRNNCCEFLASYGIIIQSVIQSYLKTPACGASLSYHGS